MDSQLRQLFCEAIAGNEIEVFDALAKDLDNFTQEDKSLILNRAIKFSKSLEFLEHVLSYGFDINNYKTESNGNFLHMAATYQEQPEIIEFLISKGLDVNSKDNDGLTPLFYALKENTNLDVINNKLRLKLCSVKRK